MSDGEFWPGGAQLALSIVVNVEEGAEYNVLDGDKAPEVVDELGLSLRKPIRNLANETNYQYGIKRGAPRVLDALAHRGIKATFTAAALALERAPQVARRIAADGHEVCAHGYRWIQQHGFDEDQEREFIRKARDSIAKSCGAPPKGWLSRYLTTENTRRLLIEEGYSYHMDDFSDDLPFWDEVDGRPIMIVPYATDTNDMKMWSAPAYMPRDWLDYLIDTFDVLYREGATEPRMMSVGLHLRIIGRPGRMAALSRFLDYVQSAKGVWFARRDAIAEHWAKTHPFEG